MRASRMSPLRTAAPARLCFEKSFSAIVCGMASAFQRECVRSGFAAGDAPEDRTGHETRAAGVIEVEEAADELAGGIETRQRRIGDVEHARGRIDLEPAESE